MCNITRAQGHGPIVSRNLEYRNSEKNIRSRSWCERRDYVIHIGSRVCLRMSLRFAQTTRRCVCRPVGIRNERLEGARAPFPRHGDFVSFSLSLSLSFNAKKIFPFPKSAISFRALWASHTMVIKKTESSEEFKSILGEDGIRKGISGCDSADHPDFVSFVDIRVKN